MPFRWGADRYVPIGVVEVRRSDYHEPAKKWIACRRVEALRVEFTFGPTKRQARRNLRDAIDLHELRY